MKIPSPKLNVVELALLAVMVAALAYVGARYRTQTRLAPYLSRSASELRPLEARYGPGRNSRNSEEWIIRDYFHDKREGVFVDVGANHHQRDSNTYYLETQLGWSGIAIEPQPKFAEGYRTSRPRTTFVPLFVSDTSNREVTLRVPLNNDLIASVDEAFIRSEGGADIQPLQTNTTTLDDVLQRSAIERIDFLSMDIELHEPAALKGFSIERYRPSLVGIESHLEVRQQILDYFAARGYVVIGKYLRADTENLWFTSRASGVATGP